MPLIYYRRLQKQHCYAIMIFGDFEPQQKFLFISRKASAFDELHHNAADGMPRQMTITTAYMAFTLFDFSASRPSRTRRPPRRFMSRIHCSSFEEPNQQQEAEALMPHISLPR